MIPAPLFQSMQAAALRASAALRDHGTGGTKPVSFTADSAAHARVMLAAAFEVYEAAPTHPRREGLSNGSPE